MRYRIIDFPHRVDERAYHQSLRAMTKRLAENAAVKSVYQVGGISSPGISDLDMVVIFKEGMAVEKNFLNDLSKEEKYLFIHNLYGISENNFADGERFVFYHTYKLLAGAEVRTNAALSSEEIQTMKIQIGLEYVVKMYITVFLQQVYGILRMRDLLLHIKALQFDLSFLGESSDRLNNCVQQVLRWRDSWFGHAPSEEEIVFWWKEYYASFNLFFESVFSSRTFYLPPKVFYRVAKNILIMPSEGSVSKSSQGFVLPNVFALFGKKYFRIQNKFTRFQFEVPIQSERIPPILGKKFLFEKKIIEYNNKYLPHFLPLTSSLHVS